MTCPGCHWHMSFTEGARQKYCNRCQDLMRHKANAGMANTPTDPIEAAASAERYRRIEEVPYAPYAFMYFNNFMQSE